MKKALIIQNAADAPPGTIGQMLQEAGIAYDTLDATKQPFPHIDGYDAVISLGGPQHVWEYAQHPYFREEERFIRHAVAQHIAFLGVCMGGQLLAQALGSPVTAHSMTELGFVEVHLTPDGRKDPLFQGLTNDALVFQWHEDVFALPTDSILLATGVNAPYQAFRYGKNAYGLQYHIEITPDIFEAWLKTFSRNAIALQDPRIIPDLREQWDVHSSVYKQHSSILIRNFVRMIVDAP